MSRLLHTVAETAELCGVTSTTVRRWINTGHLQAAPTPGHTRISQAELTRLTNNETTAP